MPHHFSFSGCGFLGVYHLGVSACLKQHVPDLLEDCKIAGASAGSFVACCLITGCSIDKCTSYVLDLVNQAESQPILGPLHPRFKLISGLQESMQQVLPADAYKLASGRLFISLTRYKDLKNFIVSEYASNNELIDALLCSGFVPFYCGIIPPRYKGDYYWDGGLSDNQPVFEEPTITVSPFSGETDICPSDNSCNFIHLNICNSSVQFTQENLHRVSIALFPPKSVTMSEICQQGYDDALRYLQKNGMVNCVYHLNAPTMPYFQGTETEAEELNTEENPDAKFEEEPHFDCRECKRNIRKTLFSSLPPVLLKVFHSAMASKDQSILKYLFQGKLFQAMSRMITSFVAPADILWAYFTSFLGKIPQRPKDLENILKPLSFLFLCFLHLLHKPCKHNKQCTELVECMDSAYSFYSFNHMDEAIPERICHNNNKKHKDNNNDSSPNPNIIPSNSKVKVENLKIHPPRKTLTDCKKLSLRCYCCRHIEDGQVTNCASDQRHLEIFPDCVGNELGKGKITSANNNKLSKSENMEAHKEQNNQTSLLNIEQDTPMANKRLFERSQSYPFCKTIYDKEIGPVQISAILNKIENMEAEKNQYLSKSTENCSNMFEAFMLDPLLSSQMRNFNGKKIPNNKKYKRNKFMEAPKGNNAYICEVDRSAVNDSVDDTGAGEILVDWERDQEDGTTLDASQVTQSVSFDAHSLSNETVFVNSTKDQIIPDIFSGPSIENMEAEKSQYSLKSTENCSNMFAIDRPFSFSQTNNPNRKQIQNDEKYKQSKLMEAPTGNNLYICEVDSIDIHDSVNNISTCGVLVDWKQEHGNTSVASQATENVIFEAHRLSNETVFVSSAKDQIAPDIFNSPTESRIDLKEHGKPLDISQTMSKSMEAHLDSFNNETVFVKRRKSQIIPDIFNDLTESSRNLKERRRSLDNPQTSENTEARSNSFDNDGLFDNCTKAQIIPDERFLKRCRNEQSDGGFLERVHSNPSVSSSEIKKHSDVPDMTMSTSLDTYLKYMNKDPVFLNYGKNRITLNDGFLERSFSDQSGFNSILNKPGHTSDTSCMTMSRSLGTHLEYSNNETVFVNYKKNSITTEQKIQKKRFQTNRFESNCGIKECYTKFNMEPTNAQQEVEPKTQSELSKFIENNCKAVNSEISSNFRTVYTSYTENHAKATVGISNDLDNLQTSDVISSVRESVSTSQSHLVRHISIEHV